IERGKLPGRELVANILLGPLVLPLVVTALALLLFFSQLGLVARPAGLFIAHTVLTIPYVMRTTLASLKSFDPALEEAAWVHGAHPWKAFWSVVLPQIRPGLVAGGIFAFLVSLDEFTVTLFLSGPGLVTMPIRVYQYIVLHVDPTVSALTSAIVVVSAVILIIAERLFKIHRYLEF
ncbi:MAG: ABC transporter permease, partial [Limnochordia bacterium]